MAKKSEARKKREKAEKKRAAAAKIVRTGKMPDGSDANQAQIDAAQARRLVRGGEMRTEGDILRGISDRVRGQGTRYIGPTGGALTFDDPRAVTARASRGLLDPTAYQAANLAGMAGMTGATTAQRRQAFKELWGEPGSDKYQEMQDWQARQMAGGPGSDVVTSVDRPTAVQGPPRFPAGYGGGYGGGLLGSGGGYGGYPVLGLGTPSGASYPAAQDAAQGWAGMLGFNIDERGGLALRPWEAASWQQSGIDPNLWNAPFAGGGLLGGGYPGAGYPGVGTPGGTTGPMPTGTKTTTPTTTTTPTMPGEPAGWIPPADFDVDQALLAAGMGPFHQWTREQHRLNQLANARDWANPDVAASSELVARAAPPGFVEGGRAPADASAVAQPFVDPAAQFQAQQTALAQAAALATQQATQQAAYQQAAFGNNGLLGTTDTTSVNPFISGM